MSDIEQHPDLCKTVKDKIAVREQWLHEAQMAITLWDSLPAEIKAMDVTDLEYSEPAKKLTVYIKGSKGTTVALKLLGFQGLVPHVVWYDKDRFWAQGEGILNPECKLGVNVTDLDKPENCCVVERTETRKEYVLVCEQTGKPLTDKE